MMVVTHEMGFGQARSRNRCQSSMDQGRKLSKDALKTEFFGSPRSDRAAKKFPVQDFIALREFLPEEFAYTGAKLRLSQPTRRTSFLDQIAYVNGSYVPLGRRPRSSVLDRRGFLFAGRAFYESLGGAGREKLIDNALASGAAGSVPSARIALCVCREKTLGIGIRLIQKELIARNDLDNGLVYIQVERAARTAGRDFFFL